MSNILTTESAGGTCDVACCPPICGADDPTAAAAEVATADGLLAWSPRGAAAATAAFGCGVDWAAPHSYGEARPEIPYGTDPPKGMFTPGRTAGSESNIVRIDLQRKVIVRISPLLAMRL